MTGDSNQQREDRSGLLYALGAYLSWGLMPAYFKLLAGIGAVEIVAWRIIVCVPFCLLILVVRGMLDELVAIARRPGWLMALAASSCFIGINWVIFIYAVNDGHVLATSLGYYLNPLITVLLGRIVLKEALSPAKWVALLLAAAGVALLAVEALDTLWITLSLACSFALYGLVRKLTPVGSVAGLTVETMLLTPPALAALLWYASGPQGSALFAGTETAALLLFAGIVTAVPLLFFATAARRLSLTTLGFMQYIAPTMTFLLSLFVYDEPFDMLKLGCVLLIWTGIAIVSWEAIRESRRRTKPLAA